MDFSEFLRNAGPLAAIAGVAYALVQAVFKLHWRVATTERDSKEALRRTEDFNSVRESVARIEENVQELLGERRHRDRRAGV